jgi:hypothetical protein
MSRVKLTELPEAGALALEDIVYVVQGGESKQTTWQKLKDSSGEGWVYIADGQYETEGAALSVPANTPTQLPNNGQSSTTLLTYGGLGKTSLTDWIVDSRHVTDIVGASYTWRVDFKFKRTSSTGGTLTLSQDIGDSSDFIITERATTFRKATGVEQAFSASWGGYALDTYQANGASFIVEADVPFDIWDIGIFIRRDFVPTVA